MFHNICDVTGSAVLGMNFLDKECKQSMMSEVVCIILNVLNLEKPQKTVLRRGFAMFTFVTGRQL